MADVPVDDTALESVATALLLAAVTLRDMADAMPPAVLAAMPPDLQRRLMRCDYQEAYDLLPGRVQAVARRYVEHDPDVVAARVVHVLREQR